MSNPQKYLIIFVAFFTLNARTVHVTTPSRYQAAIANAAAGDTIAIAAGTYPDVQAPQSADGTLADPIVVRGESKETVVFDSHGEGLKHYPKHWIFENIYFKGNNSYHLFHIKPGAKGYLTIRNCHFSGVADKAIKIDFAAYSGPTSIWPDYILVENCTMEVGQGGLMNNDGADYCTCRNNYTYGFIPGGVGYIFFSKGGLAYTIFENNLVVGGRWGPISVGGGSMSVPGEIFRHDDDLAAAYPNKTIEMINSVIRNNIVINGEAGVHSSTTLDCEIYNNTLINCTRSLEIHPHHGDPVGLKFYNNLLISTGSIKNGGPFLEASNNTSLDMDPSELFVSWNQNDPAQSDFRIRQSAVASVGTGMVPHEHADWRFHALPSSGFYDYYGTLRQSPPLIGATEVEGATQGAKRDIRAGPNAMPLEIYPDGNGSVISLHSDRGYPLIDILVQDLQGRHIRTLHYGPVEKGLHTWRFDHRDHDNAPVGAGWYIARISTGKDVAYKPFAVQRR
ncbi:MAG: hypothetical protein GF350_11865 [Chitinivibrionales bacterium]|nr:hypothetical protein [Chitinivibrionales bacterium]